jgi:nucleolar complex protein 3
VTHLVLIFSFLLCVQKYVQVLIKSLKSDVHKKTAARCVSGLIEAIPHFNFRDSLMSSLIPLMDSTDSECRFVTARFRFVGYQ